MPEQSKYLKVDTDLESGEYPDPVPQPDLGYLASVSHLTGEPGAEPHENGAVDSMGYVQSIPVSEEEARSWTAGYAEFRAEMECAHDQLRIAQVRWKNEVIAWQARVAAAAAAYLPVHEEIEQRKEMVELERGIALEREREEKERLRAVLAEAEAAVLGPREWIFATPDRGRIAPIIHRLSCVLVTKAMEKRPSSWLREMYGLVPLTRDEVLAKRGRYTRLCGRCKAEHHLNA